MSTSAVLTEEINTSTRYTYDYTHLPPLAMVGAVTEEEAFSARPDFIRLAARPTLEILINSIMIGIRNKGETADFLQQVLESIQDVARQLNSDAGLALSNAIARESDKQGSPTTLPQLKAMLESIIDPLTKTLTLKDLFGIAQINGRLGTISGRPSSVEDYDQVFQFISLPEVSRKFREDSQFAAMRVAGPNPVTIERMKTLDARLPITDEQYQSVMGTRDTLKTALADGRLYLADYSAFDGAVNGSFPDGPKFNYAPLALFAVPRGGRSLVPVAIQCGPGPGPDNPIFLPRDGDRWFMAKTTVQVADTNVHQAMSHLGRTHLFIEPVRDCHA